MAVIYHFLLGFSLAFLGSTIPGMLNMTAVSIALDRGPRAGQRYALGAGTAFFLHASIALVFAGYLAANPSVFVLLRQFAILVFIGLAFLFLRMALQPKAVAGSKRQGGAFTIGLILSCLNVLVIPYFFGVASYLEQIGYFVLTGPNIGGFVFGAMLGAFLLFSLYARFADFIARRATFISRNINYLLATLFMVLAVIQIVQLVISQ